MISDMSTELEREHDLITGERFELSDVLDGDDLFDIMPAQSNPRREKMRRRRQQQPREVPTRVLEEERILYLYPFLGGQQFYESHMTNPHFVSEGTFWREIGAIAEEGRPIEIARLVKRRFSKRETFRGRSTEDHTKVLNDGYFPYPVLPPDEQERFIDGVISGLQEEVDQIEQLFGDHRSKGYLYVEKKGGETCQRLYYRTEKRGDVTVLVEPDRERSRVRFMEMSQGNRNSPPQFVYATERGPIEGLESRIPTLKRIFVDVDREREKLVYVSEQLRELAPSSEAVIRASTAAYLKETEIHSGEEELARLDEALAGRISRRRTKKVSRQAEDLRHQIYVNKERLGVLREKIQAYRTQEVKDRASRDASEVISPPNNDIERAKGTLDDLTLIYRGEAADVLYEAQEIIKKKLPFRKFSFVDAIEHYMNFGPSEEFRGVAILPLDGPAHLIAELSAKGVTPLQYAFDDYQEIRFAESGQDNQLSSDEYNGPRIELHQDSLGGIPFYRAHFYGIPLTTVSPKTVQRQGGENSSRLQH